MFPRTRKATVQEWPVHVQIAPVHLQNRTKVQNVRKIRTVQDKDRDRDTDTDRDRDRDREGIG